MTVGLFCEIFLRGVLVAVIMAILDVICTKTILGKVQKQGFWRFWESSDLDLYLYIILYFVIVLYPTVVKNKDLFLELTVFAVGGIMIMLFLLLGAINRIIWKIQKRYVIKIQSFYKAKIVSQQGK